MAQTSFKLNNQHRAEITSSVIQEWSKNNPAPPELGRKDLLVATAKAFKESPESKRTARLVAAFKPGAGDAMHVKTEQRVYGVVQDDNGEERSRQPYYIPKKLAVQLDIPFADSSVVHDSDNMYSDYWRYDDDGSVMAHAFEAIKYIESAQAVVLLDDNTEAYARYKAGREARKAWDSQRAQLKSEVEDLLQQYNTTKQLREGWPEIAGYIPARLADPASVKLPVLAASKLSERLGIK